MLFEEPVLTAIYVVKIYKHGASLYRIMSKCLHCMRIECSHKGCPGCEICSVCTVDPSVMANLPEKWRQRQAQKAALLSAFTNTKAVFEKNWIQIDRAKFNIISRSHDMRFDAKLQKLLHEENEFCAINTKEYNNFAKVRDNLIDQLNRDMSGARLPYEIKLLKNPTTHEKAYAREFGVRIMNYNRVLYERRLQGLMSCVISSLCLNHDLSCAWQTKTVETAWSSPHFRSDSSVDARFVVEAVADTGLDRLNSEEDLKIMDVSKWRACRGDDKPTKKYQVCNTVLEGLLRNEITKHKARDGRHIGITWSGKFDLPIILSCDFVEVDGTEYCPVHDDNGEDIKRYIDTMKLTRASTAATEDYLTSSRLRLRFQTQATPEAYPSTHLSKQKDYVCFKQFEETKREQRQFVYNYSALTLEDWIEKNPFYYFETLKNVWVRKQEIFADDDERRIIWLNTNSKNEVKPFDILKINCRDGSELAWVDVVSADDSTMVEIILGDDIFSTLVEQYPELKKDDTFTNYDQGDVLTGKKSTIKVFRLHDTLDSEQYPSKHKINAQNDHSNGTTWDFQSMIDAEHVTSAKNDAWGILEDLIEQDNDFAIFFRICLYRQIAKAAFGRRREDFEQNLKDIVQNNNGFHVPVAYVLGIENARKSRNPRKKVFTQNSELHLSMHDVSLVTNNDFLKTFFLNKGDTLVLRLKPYSVSKLLASNAQREFGSNKKNFKRLSINAPDWQEIDFQNKCKLTTQSWFEVCLSKKKVLKPACIFEVTLTDTVDKFQTSKMDFLAAISAACNVSPAPVVKIDSVRADKSHDGSDIIVKISVYNVKVKEDLKTKLNLTAINSQLKNKGLITAKRLNFSVRSGKSTAKTPQKTAPKAASSDEESEEDEISDEESDDEDDAADEPKKSLAVDNASDKDSKMYICRYRITNDRFPYQDIESFKAMLDYINYSSENYNQQQVQKAVSLRAKRQNILSHVLARFMTRNVRESDRLTIPLKQVSRIQPIT